MRCTHQLKIRKTGVEIFAIQCQKCGLCRTVDFTPSKDEIEHESQMAILDGSISDKLTLEERVVRIENMMIQGD